MAYEKTIESKIIKTKLVGSNQRKTHLIKMVRLLDRIEMKSDIIQNLIPLKYL